MLLKSHPVETSPIEPLRHRRAVERLSRSMRGANEVGNFFNLPGSAPRPIIHDSHRVYIEYKKFTESRGRSHIVRPSTSLAPSLPLPESPRFFLPPRARPATVHSRSRNTPMGWARGISPLSVSVYGSNKTGTTHSFCVEYSGGACWGDGDGRRGGASGCYRPSGFISVPEGRREDTHTHTPHRTYKERERERGEGTVKRYWIPCVSQRFYEDCPGFYYRRNVG